MFVAPRFEIWALDPNAKSKLTFLNLSCSGTTYWAFTASSGVWSELDFVRHDDDSISGSCGKTKCVNVVRCRKNPKTDTIKKLWAHSAYKHHKCLEGRRKGRQCNAVVVVVEVVVIYFGRSSGSQTSQAQLPESEISTATSSSNNLSIITLLPMGSSWPSYSS
jgi:hypothetical protein